MPKSDDVICERSLRYFKNLDFEIFYYKILEIITIYNYRKLLRFSNNNVWLLMSAPVYWFSNLRLQLVNRVIFSSRFGLIMCS